MTTAIVEERVGQTNDFDPFQYFEGGREGVQRRFCDIFRRELEARPFKENKDFTDLCQAAEVNPQEVYRVANGDYKAVSGTMIERFSHHVCRCNLYDIFGRLNLSEEDRGKLTEKADTERFPGVHPQAPDRDRIEFYLITRALQILD